MCLYCILYSTVMNNTKFIIIVSIELVFFVITFFLSSHYISNLYHSELIDNSNNNTYNNPSLVSDLHITYPKGGEEWQSGKTYPISWTGGGTTIGVSLSFNESKNPYLEYGTPYAFTTSGLKNIGSYALKIPIELSGSYLLNVLDENKHTISTSSIKITPARNPNPQIWDKPHPPTFSDFPAALYEGTVARVDLKSSPLGHDFRTSLTESNKLPVNFGGKYTIDLLGCGQGCVSGVIFDRTNGKIGSVLPSSNQRGNNYIATSTLFILNLSYDSQGNQGVTFTDDSPFYDNVFGPVQYYVWDGNTFALIYQQQCVLSEAHMQVCK